MRSSINAGHVNLKLTYLLQSLPQRGEGQATTEWPWDVCQFPWVRKACNPAWSWCHLDWPSKTTIVITNMVSSMYMKTQLHPRRPGSYCFKWKKRDFECATLHLLTVTPPNPHKKNALFFFFLQQAISRGWEGVGWVAVRAMGRLKWCYLGLLSCWNTWGNVLDYYWQCGAIKWCGSQALEFLSKCNCEFQSFYY